MGNDQVEQDQSDLEDAPGPFPPHITASLRGHRRQTERRLIVGGFGLMFLVGGALIWHFYSLGAMLMAWFFLAGGTALFGGLYLILKFMEKWTREEE